MHVCMLCTRHCAATNLQRECRRICNRLPGRLHENVFAVHKICSAQGTDIEEREGKELQDGPFLGCHIACPFFFSCLPLSSSSAVCVFNFPAREKGCITERASVNTKQHGILNSLRAPTGLMCSGQQCTDEGLRGPPPRLLSPPADHLSGLMMMFVTAFITVCRQATSRLGDGKQRHLCDRAH